MAFIGKLVCIWLTLSSSYGSISLTLVLIRRDGDLSTLCHICGLYYHQRVLKTFFGPSYLCCENGVEYACIWLTFHLATVQFP